MNEMKKVMSDHNSFHPNLVQTYLLYASLKVNYTTFDALKAKFIQVSPSAMQTVAKCVLKGDNDRECAYVAF